MIRVGFWTAVFLILLRVCIGWHFFAEGLNKVRSAYTGDAVVNEKPFSSEAYFNEAQGPFGKLVRKWVGDPNQELIDKLTPKPAEGDASRLPDVVNTEWDVYYTLFINQYKLDETQKTQAEKNLADSKTAYVKWLLTGETADPVELVSPGPGSKADFEKSVTIQQRVNDLKAALETVKTAYDKNWVMQKDVEGANLQTKKKDAATIRKQLNTEYEARTDLMKKSLASVLGARVNAYAAKVEGKDETATVQAMLVPMASGNNPLGKMWDEYGEHIKTHGKAPGEELNKRVDLIIANTKTRFDNWLAGKDPFSGLPLEVNYVEQWKAALVKAQEAKQKRLEEIEGNAELSPEDKDEEVAKAGKEVKALTTDMQGEFKYATDNMTKVLDDEIATPQAQGFATKPQEYYLWFIPKWQPIQYIDWSTRWFLLIVGGCLMIGLWSRLSAFGGAMFLLMTILSVPNAPWLPASPLSEGNYVYVNKNVIEMLALFVLMTVSTGMWAGVDSICDYFFGGWRARRKSRKLEKQQQKQQTRSFK